MCNNMKRAVISCLIKGIKKKKKKKLSRETDRGNELY